jgi:hypothetical protein
MYWNSPGGSKVALRSRDMTTMIDLNADAPA